MNKEVRPRAVLAVFLPSLALLTGVVVIARTQQRPAWNMMSRNNSQEFTYHPLPKDVTEKFNAQSVRVKAVEDQSRALLAQGHYAAAEAACRRALLMSPKINGDTFNSIDWQLLGEIYMEQGRNKEALPYFAEAMRHTRDTTLSLDIALAYCHLGELDKARKFYSDKMILRYSSVKPEELPGTSTAKTLEASILFARGVEADVTAMDEKAVQDYAAAAHIVPTNGHLAFLQARALRRLKRYPEAVHYFAIAATYGDAEIAQDALDSLAAWPAADREAALQEVAKLNPRAWQLLGELRLNSARYQEALVFFNKAMPNLRNPMLSLDIALAYCRLGDLVHAKQFYADRMILQHVVCQSAELPGTSTAQTLEASIFLARGLEMERTGLTETAPNEYQNAAQLVPTNGLLADCQARALEKSKRHSEAVQCFAIAATFGKGETKQRALNSLAAWPKAQSEVALREAVKLKPQGKP